MRGKRKNPKAQTQNTTQHKPPAAFCQLYLALLRLCFIHVIVYFMLNMNSLPITAYSRSPV